MNTPCEIIALRIAIDAHKGQVDRAGEPYILHPIAVASRVKTEAEFVTALLHDVLEDSDYTDGDLRDAGIPEYIIDALQLLTHNKSMPYMEYIKQIKENPLARAVKIADLSHNMELSRLPEVTKKDLERAEKYKKAMAILM